MVKSLPAKQETWIRSLGQEDPLEKEMATHSSILAWEIPWTEEPGGPQSMGWKRVRHHLATKRTHTHTPTHQTAEFQVQRLWLFIFIPPVTSTWDELKQGLLRTETFQVISQLLIQPQLWPLSSLLRQQQVKVNKSTARLTCFPSIGQSWLENPWCVLQSTESVKLFHHL